MINAGIINQFSNLNPFFAFFVARELVYQFPPCSTEAWLVIVADVSNTGMPMFTPNHCFKCLFLDDESLRYVVLVT